MPLELTAGTVEWAEPPFSLQWRPFPHANFTQRILLLFIFFIISYLSLPDVFRAVFLCCKLIPFMF